MANEILGGRYEIQQQLAKKAGRKTLLARDLKTQELVVAKLLNFNSEFEWDDLKIFEREAQTLKALSHPAIPRYLEYLELEAGSSKGFALVQTYVAGKSVEEYLSVGRTFSEAEVKEIAKALLQILTYLHERQPPVVHRDIKLSNILLGERSGNSVGQVYLVDFGSVQNMAATKSGTITVVGTYGYMPPEQFGDRAVPASDLYSLGATLIAIATGSHPADLPQKDGRIHFEHIANISPAFTEWLKWMTEPSLDKRLSSVHQALEVLDNPQLSITSVPQQPVGSTIRLTKTRDSLEILIGSADLENVSRSMVGGIITFFMGMVCMQPVPVTPIPWNAVLGIIAGFLVTIGASSLFSLIFIFNKIKIKVDKQKITLTQKWFGIKTMGLQSQVLAINKLIYIPRYLTHNGEQIVETPPKLRIWLGTKNYEIKGNNSMTDTEIEWIAKELSNWLDIPISYIDYAGKQELHES